MKFNLNALKSLFGKLAKSGMADDVVKFATNYGDDVALGALDVIDDVPKSVALDDIADAYNWRQTHGVTASPITPSEFVNQYKASIPNRAETRALRDSFPDMFENAPTNLDLAYLRNDIADVPTSYKLDSTPDYSAMDIRPTQYGQYEDLIGSMDYPDGFTNPDDFARYYEDLERGFRTNPTARVSGHTVSQPDYWVPGYDTNTLIIDNKPYHYPAPIDLVEDDYVYAYPDNTKANILNRYRSSTYPHRSFDDSSLKVYGAPDSWIPHRGDALGKFYKKHGRLPNGMSSDGFNKLWADQTFLQWF